jgi:activator of HSP90 ATPase
METKTLRQSVSFSASPDEVYALLMDAKKHASFTGGPVKMSNKPGGKFVVFDGYCHGYNIELLPGKKIVQAWHFAEDGWPDDHFSICTFTFVKQKAGTKLTFVQTGLPAHKCESLKEGWKNYYWGPMKEYLDRKK